MSETNTPDPTDTPVVTDTPIPTETPVATTAPVKTDDDTQTVEVPVPATVVVQEDTTPRIYLEIVGAQAINDILEKRAEILGETQFQIAASTPGSYENNLVTILNDHSVEVDRTLSSINQIKDKTTFDQKLMRDGKSVMSGILTPRRGPSEPGKIFTREEARIEYAIKTGEMKRVMLYNSGFSIDIEAPDLTALNTFFTRAQDDTNTYGRQFGSYFYYFNDLMIKEALIDLVTPLVLGSSLKNWNRGNTLRQNIKIYDLKVILHAIASMMFPEGFDYTHICTNPLGTCTYQETIKIDINRLLRHDYSKIPERCWTHLAKGNESTPEIIAEYQEQLGFDGTHRVVFGREALTMRVPSIEDYLTYGRLFNSELLASIGSSTQDDIMRGLLFSFYKIFTPFVHELYLLNPDDSIDFKAPDMETIAMRLSRMRARDDKQIIAKNFDTFFSDSEISFIGYPAFPCPTCQHVHERGYYTVDPQTHFFILALTKLSIA